MSEFITPSDSAVEPGHRNSVDLVRDEVAKMCLSILDEWDFSKSKSAPVNERTLRRGINGESLDDKTVRTIACLFYKTEDFSVLIEVVPNFLKSIIENANNKLSHSGEVSYEIARNPELVQLWNLCSGYGCSKVLGEKYFSDKFEILIKILEENRLVTKSVLRPELWIASGDMMKCREDGLYHYENMFHIAKKSLATPGNGKFIQFCGEISEESFEYFQEKLVELYKDCLQKDALTESKNDSVKFNFQASICDLNAGEPNEIQ